MAMTSVVKDELSRVPVIKPCCRKAETATLLPTEARERALALPVFVGCEVGDWFIARTGYTGEDGFELMLPAAQAVDSENRAPRRYTIAGMTKWP